MTFQRSFLKMMPDTVQRAAWTGQDKNGQPTFAAAVDIRARVVRKPTVVRRSGSFDVEREVISSATVWCAGEIGWDAKDQITLPDGSTPVILDVRKYPDGDGIHHEMVLV